MQKSCEIKGDVVVSGDGPVGFFSACLLSLLGLRVFLLRRVGGGDPSRVFEGRTVALMQPALKVLGEIGIDITQKAEVCAPLLGLRIIDGLRGGRGAFFQAEEWGIPWFGWNIPLGFLLDCLEKQALDLGVEFVSYQSYCVDWEKDRVRFFLKGGDEIQTETRIVARYGVAAEGRHSLLRKKAEIVAKEKFYKQSALFFTFSHACSHEGISLEYHRQGGPFTTVPLPDNRSSVVWMDTPEKLEAICQGPLADLKAEVQRQVGDILGQVFQVTPPALLGPLSEVSVDRLAKKRIFLAGDCAHAVAPIGAQGLNMGIEDAVCLAHLSGLFLTQGKSLGGFEMMEAYHKARYGDSALRQGVIDGVNRSLMSPFGGIHALRALGIETISKIKELRQFVVGFGLGAQGIRAE